MLIASSPECAWLVKLARGKQGLRRCSPEGL
jgi:hypothetical protein